jgi:hypothetical protein
VGGVGGLCEVDGGGEVVGVGVGGGVRVWVEEALRVGIVRDGAVGGRRRDRVGRWNTRTSGTRGATFEFGAARCHPGCNCISFRHGERIIIFLL